MNRLNFRNFKKGISYKGKFKEKGFVAFPKTMFFDVRLTSNHLRVAGIIEIHAFGGKKECFPSISTIAAETNTSRKTVIAAIKELIKYGYIEADKKKGKSTIYYLKFW